MIRLVENKGRLAEKRGRLTYNAHSESFVTVNTILLQPLVALLAGILILLIPRLLNFIVAVYLIIVGISGLWPHLLR